MALKVHQIHQILVQTRQVIALPEHWTTRTFARTREGRSTDVGSPDAEQFCLRGGICEALRRRRFKDFKPEGDLEYEVTAFVAQVLGTSDLGDWNNKRNHAAVLAGLDQAIVAAKAA